MVQKFGGTSVADADRIKQAAGKMIRAKEQGHPVVATVSAQAGMTDELLGLAREITPDPDPRELDMLVSTGEQMSIALVCMTLHAMGHEAISLTGGQVGIMTDGVHTKARIRNVKTRRIRRELDRGRIVVVAGFQGMSDDGFITTLGRGASDLTAVALAAALDADLCEIYTDVDGIYTADPRVVPAAAKLDAVSYDEILELSSVGARVVQSRAIEVAKKFRVPVCVRSTFNDDPGTLICNEVTGFEDVPVCGAALSLNESRITIAGLPDKPGAASQVVGAIGKRKINIDMIVQSFPAGGSADVSLLVKDVDLSQALSICNEIKKAVGAEAVVPEGEIARVSAVGRGMIGHPGIAAKLCRELGRRGINIKMITTSEINISVVVDAKDGESALRAVHEIFGLDSLPTATPRTDRPPELYLSELDAVEGLHVQDVALDEDQVELKIPRVADRPGAAGELLSAIAEAGVNLDVVLQTSCESGISVTMSRGDVERAKEVVDAMSARPTGEPAQIGTGITKVSISGVGLRSHAGAASKVFGVLAREGINLQMIGTSEAKISVVVDEAEGERAAAALRNEFHL
ncbi:MAG: aspartate kinase [Planctomycetota bacterium]